MCNLEALCLPGQDKNSIRVPRYQFLQRIENLSAELVGQRLGSGWCSTEEAQFHVRLAGQTGHVVVFGDLTGSYHTNAQVLHLCSPMFTLPLTLAASEGFNLSMTTNKPLGIAFFGAGDVSPLHAEGVRRCADANLLGLWNLDPVQGREKAAAFGCRTYDTPGELLADPAVEAVSVLTNLESHLEFATLALEAGKHVLVEKPVGVSVAEIQTMQEVADQAGRVCMPAHNFIP
jgi:hypothetical protein